MGAKASKPVQSATRKFPTRAPGNAAPPHTRPQPSTQSRSEPRASYAKDDAIKRDSIDPDPNPSTNAAFSQRLKQMGVATPNPTLSNSSTASSYPGFPEQKPGAPSFAPLSQNRTLSALEARQRLQERAQAEYEDRSKGSEFLDVGTLTQVLIMQGRGVPHADIEKRFRLKSGVVERLGPKGVTVPYGQIL
ncbi:uncharacterized protein GGS22DRAFT_191332 [Annulohypoxylon maeteangense]|uniref:uncharacterized protein n=1 Tax=Annulohypoxylon maeteangense TaxID=1927788 RepID=UPI0020087570|nr:uncharacterized protein GGS22DRAFT_191332 [Annulohypoxylon maeteangense]KAI0882161.1 hypothetical protein GGS22DRAFT_191332 [Annulohypoxylon maeteangense]